MAEHPTQSAGMVFTLAMFGLAVGLAFAVPSVVLKCILVTLVATLGILLWITPFVTRWRRIALSIASAIVGIAILGSAFIPTSTNASAPFTVRQTIAIPPESCSSHAVTMFCIDGRVETRDSRNPFGDTVTAAPSDIIDLRIIITNTTGKVMQDVMINLTLDQRLALVADSVQILDSNNPGGASVAQGNDIASVKGVNIGTYNPGSNSILVAKVRVYGIDYWTCGAHPLEVSLGVSGPDFPTLHTVLPLNVRAC
jgi:hypothetical protein